MILKVLAVLTTVQALSNTFVDTSDIYEDSVCQYAESVDMDYLDVFRRKALMSRYLSSAAVYVGVSEEWAYDSHLLELIKKESAFDPSAKNPVSSAFGLFQMLRNTWESYLPEIPYGTLDPFWQSVGGLRYILKMYRTPERANKFYQATMNSDPLIAPPDLQFRVEKWLQNGYKGY